jgi:hypothetical protein
VPKEELMDDASCNGEKATRAALVEHLLTAMQHEGLTVEAAATPGHADPAAMKVGALRLGRVRPDVAARDQRRTVFGAVLTRDEVDESRTRGRLEALARGCRILVVCLPVDMADRAIEALFDHGDVPHRGKIRLLRYPDTSWAELPRPRSG